MNMAAPLHAWPRTPAEAAALQRELAPQILVRSIRPLRELRYAAGLDVSYERSTDSCHAAVVMVDLRSMETLEERTHSCVSPFPYIPGLLSFRELPPLLEAMASMRQRPDVLIADAQGIAHPRRFGLACHAGLWMGIPSVGCAKSILIGTCEEPGAESGASSPLIDPKTGETLGAALRTRRGVRPVYVSTGHAISLEDAAALVLACAPRFRIPEPVRRAHVLSNRARMDYLVRTAAPFGSRAFQ